MVKGRDALIRHWPIIGRRILLFHYNYNSLEFGPKMRHNILILLEFI